MNLEERRKIFIYGEIIINNKKISSIAFPVNKKATSPMVAMVAMLRKISKSL